MLQREGARQASSALSTADQRPDRTAIQQSVHRPRATAARKKRRRGVAGAATAAPEGGSGVGVAGAEWLVRLSAVAPCVTCGICGRLLRDATAFTECLHAFCKKCVYDKITEEHIQRCPKCGILLGCSPLEKLRPDHSLQHIRSVMFPANRHEVINMKKRKERVSSESDFSSMVDITVEGSAALKSAASLCKTQKIVVEVIGEAVPGLGEQELAYESSTLDFALGRDDLSGIRCRDSDSACSFADETRALIVWQPSPFQKWQPSPFQLASRQDPEDAVHNQLASRQGPEDAVHNQLASRQDPEDFRLPMTSYTEYQRQGPTAKTIDTSFMVGSSSHARRTDDENLREDFLTMFDEDFALGRDDLSGIRCQDSDSACSFADETRALIVWQPSPFQKWQPSPFQLASRQDPEDAVHNQLASRQGPEDAVHNQLASRQDPEDFRLPMTSYTEYQRQGPTAKTIDTSFMVGSSSHARRTDDENLREDILAMFNEGIMGRYDAYISKLKAENAKLIEELENEKASALERTRTEERLQRELENGRAAAALEKTRMEERLQRELENERAAAAVRTRIIEKSLQRELEREREASAERIRVLEHEREAAVERIRVLHEELENGRAENQDLRSHILEKSDELATLNYSYDMLESARKHLENQVDRLNMELDYTRKEHKRYVNMVLNVAKSIPSDLEPINSDARPRPISGLQAHVRVRPSPTGS